MRGFQKLDPLPTNHTVKNDAKNGIFVIARYFHDK